MLRGGGRGGLELGGSEGAEEDERSEERIGGSLQGGGRVSGGGGVTCLRDV